MPSPEMEWKESKRNRGREDGIRERRKEKKKGRVSNDSRSLTSGRTAPRSGKLSKKSNTVVGGGRKRAEGEKKNRVVTKASTLFYPSAFASGPMRVSE